MKKYRKCPALHPRLFWASLTRSTGQVPFLAKKKRGNLDKTVQIWDSLGLHDKMYNSAHSYHKEYVHQINYMLQDFRQLGIA